MQKHMLFVMDPIANINPKKDSSLAIALAAQDAGWQLSYAELSDLYLQNGEAWALITPLTVQQDDHHWFKLGEAYSLKLDDSLTIMMRKDPPFDSPFLYATHILQRAANAGSLVVNNPQSLRDCNEKLFATEFPDCCPPLMVSNNPILLRDFYSQHKDVIFKPLDGMGGSGIFRCKPEDSNFASIIEILTNNSQDYIMAQKFIPAIDAGDKRILMVDGVAIDYALARIPAKGELRGNLAAGGTGVAQPLSQRDREIAERVGPTLKEKGLLFVGLDVIGDYLTEINVTSPTCIKEIDKAYNTQIGSKLIHAIERRRQLASKS
ncbi:glutathione synthase [Marinagarivorans algicola]|uniref:glutathione synthase n=1 Tax=Marinagarivorans algicola TaxID=1513270 RepID=UPI0006B65B79|nr:glutathione synthase [Marinagarivorans algicola]